MLCLAVLGLCCGIDTDLPFQQVESSSLTKDRTWAPALEAWSPSHWAPKEGPWKFFWLTLSWSFSFFRGCLGFRCTNVHQSVYPDERFCIAKCAILTTRCSYSACLSACARMHSQGRTAGPTSLCVCHVDKCCLCPLQRLCRLSFHRNLWYFPLIHQPGVLSAF